MRFFVGADTETIRFRSGWMVPRQICATFAVRLEDADALLAVVAEAGNPSHLQQTVEVGSQPYLAVLVDRPGAAALWPVILAAEGCHLVFHNKNFDVMGVIHNFPAATEAALKAAGEGRIWDTADREKLQNNAKGNLEFQVDPFTGKLTNRGVYRLSTLAMRYLGVDLSEDKTDPAAWRLRYHELDGVPLVLWPEEAVSYAIMDSVYPIPILTQQDRAYPARLADHDTRCTIWPDRSPPLPDAPDGIRRFAGEYHLAINLGYTAAAAWGLRTNPERVAKTLATWAADVDRADQIGREAGFVRADGSRNVKLLRKLVGAAIGGAPGDLELAAGLFEVRNGRPPENAADRKEAKAYLPADKRARAALVSAECRQRGLEPDLYTPTGLLKTGREALVLCDDPVLASYAECLASVKAQQNWAQALQDGTTTPLTYGVDPLKATGRISVFGRLYHQIPRRGQVREAHQPRPGWCYVMADYDQLELRAMAQLQYWLGMSGELRQVFLDDQDPHVLVAVAIANEERAPAPDGGAWTYEQGARARKGVYGPDVAATFDNFRQTAKGANFGLLGGLGPLAFVKYCRGMGLHIDVDGAKRIKAIWGQVFPCNLAYLAYIGQLVEYADEVTVKQYCSGRVRGGVNYTAAANTFFQGLAADGMTMANWLLFQRQVLRHEDHPGLFGTRQVVNLHDEKIIEAPLDRFREAAAGLTWAMVTGMGQALPDVPVATEAAAALVWSKATKPVYDESGELQLWEPA